jgi:cysteine-S-conjugate beta-lyase
MAGIVPSVNALAYTAAEAAYTEGSAWLAELLDYLRGNREIVTRAVEDMPGLSMPHVEATYLAWIDTRGANLDYPVKFFESAGVGLGNGMDFGGPGFVRLTFGCPRSMLLEGLNRMRQALMIS